MTTDLQPRATGETYAGDGAILSMLQRTTFIRELLRGQPGKWLAYTAEQLPAASEQQRYACVVLTGDPGVADEALICLKLDDDTYDWINLGSFEAQANTTDLKDVLVAIGALLDGGATPLDLDGGALTAGIVTGTTAIFTGTLSHQGASLGFYNHAAIAKPTLSGSRGGNAALATVCDALKNLGLVTDSSTV